MAAVISRALSDLEDRRKVTKASPRVKDEAMAWVNGPDCEAYCLALDADYKAVRDHAAALYRQFLDNKQPIRRKGFLPPSRTKPRSGTVR
jgi:hypothetical protein